MSLPNESPTAMGNDWSLRCADGADAELITAILTSSRTGDGVADLRAHIARLVAERGGLRVDTST